MAITLKDAGAAADPQNGFNNLTWRAVDVTFDNSYPTGGYAVALSDLGMARVLLVVVSAPAGYSLEYDYTNNKIKAYRLQLLGHTHTENTAAAYTQNATSGAVNSAGLTGPLIELTNGTTVLNGITARLFVMGTI